MYCVVAERVALCCLWCLVELVVDSVERLGRGCVLLVCLWLVC